MTLEDRIDAALDECGLDYLGTTKRQAVEAIASAVSPPKNGIYIASKVKHADRWRFLRDKLGYPIISTWIDEAGEGQSKDLGDLWQRCITEASSAKVLVVNRELGETLKGAWIEMGAALAVGVPILAIGIEEFTVAKDSRIRHFPHTREAMAEALRIAQH